MAPAAALSLRRLSRRAVVAVSSCIHGARWRVRLRRGRWGVLRPGHLSLVYLDLEGGGAGGAGDEMLEDVPLVVPGDDSAAGFVACGEHAPADVASQCFAYSGRPTSITGT